MKYRETTLLARTDVGTEGTKTIPVNVQDVISRIDVTFEVYIGGEQSSHFSDSLPRIELVDGSDVLFSLTGPEAMALGLYNRKGASLMSPYACAGNYWLGTFPMDFGRYLYDPELALDPKRFRNLQLKISHNETGFMDVTGTNYLEVLASVFDEAQPSPRGFLMAKEHNEYSPASEDSYHEVDLPTDHPIRQLLVRGFLTQKTPDTVVDELRITEDGVKRIVLDLNLVRYVKRMMGVWKPIVELWDEYSATAADTYDRYFTPTSEYSAMVGVTRESFEAMAMNDSMRGGYAPWRGEGGHLTQGLVTGFLPCHCIQVPFGVQDEIDSWYDVREKGSVLARYLSAANWSGATVATVLEQLRHY